MSKPVARSSETETHPSGDRVVVFHKPTSHSIVLNPVGAWIWEQLSVPKTKSQLLQDMTGQFPDVDASRLETDLEAYLDELASNDLIEK